MKLAIVTCKKLPLGIEEDQPLYTALKELNIVYEVHAWDATVDWSLFDLCLLRSVWDYHYRTNEFNQWISRISQVTQIINDPAVVMWNQNKKYLSELSEFGITVAPTVWLKPNTSVDLAKILNDNEASSYFLKPVVGADSSDTLRFENNKAGIKSAIQHLDQLQSNQEMMLQPFLNSVETFGETSAIFIAGDFTHAVRKIPVAGDYRVQDTFGARDISYELNPAEFSLAEACIHFLSNKFTEVLYARFDFLHGADGTVYLNEAELIEPSLFFQHQPVAAMKLAKCIQQKFRPLEDEPT